MIELTVTRDTRQESLIREGKGTKRGKRKGEERREREGRKKKKESKMIGVNKSPLE